MTKTIAPRLIDVACKLNLGATILINGVRVRRCPGVGELLDDIKKIVVSRTTDSPDQIKVIPRINESRVRLSTDCAGAAKEQNLHPC